jgi:hypothetical protein
VSRIPNIALKSGEEYVDKSDLPPAKDLPIAEALYDNECHQYEAEFARLVYLTQKKCSSTPEHITHFRRDKDNPWVQNGHMCFVAMTKLPGRTLSDIWRFEPVSAEQRDEQRRIQEAFKQAML